MGYKHPVFVASTLRLLIAVSGHSRYNSSNAMLKQVTPLLQVRDLDHSASFYRNQLGFDVGSTEGGFCMIRRDDCLIFLAQKTRDVDVTNKTARARDDDWCNYDLHIHCEPGSLDTLYSEFRARGVEMPKAYEAGPVMRSYGVRDFSVIDPDGYDIVFGEERPEDDTVTHNASENNE
jgi:hypothetical protein